MAAARPVADGDVPHPEAPGPPPARHRALAVLLAANSVAALGGAAGLATGAIDLEPDLAARLPLDSPVLAGVALALVVALPLALTAGSAWRGEAQTADLLVGAGVLLGAWIVVQLGILRAFSPFQPFYAGVGAALIATGERLHRAERAVAPGRHRSTVVHALRCALATTGLLARHRLRLRADRVGTPATLPDGRTFTTFRETLRRPDREVTDPVVLAVWFHLRAVPVGADRRRRAFQRLSLANTLLFAGFDGFVTKRWLLDEATADWAGLYVWDTRPAAERYGRFITSVLRPLSTPGSVGYAVVPPAWGAGRHPVQNDKPK